jgi:hypothetical protein
MSCTLCHYAMPEGEWCRACGEGQPAVQEPVEPMSPLRVALRDAKGGWLSTDGPRERAAYLAAKEGRRDG